jgi:membrane protein required for colicin V production
MAASLLALVLGVWGAIRFADITSAFLQTKLNVQTQYLSLISFALTFIAIVICINLLAYALDKLINAGGLGLANRVAGLLFSLAKASFILSILLVVINTIDKQVPFIPEEHKLKSFFYSPLSKLAPAVFPFLDFDTLRGAGGEKGQKEYSL